jgi:hypothetical protein
MAGLAPGIHGTFPQEDVDGRIKSSHDELIMK